MKKFFTSTFLFIFLALGVILSQPVSAQSYTTSDVASHNTASNCWVIYSDRVYNLTDYLSTHDTRYYFIDSWCGTDMTTAYDTKDGQGQGHKPSTTTNLLSTYLVGDVGISQTTTTNTPTPTTTDLTTNTTSTTPSASLTTTVTPTVISTKNTTSTTLKNPYDFWTPFIIVTVLLWGNYFLSKTTFWKTNFKPLTYNMIWNTLLIISLIPSAVFGLFMILQYSFPELSKINFNFLYWHVEGSICFAVLVISHIILRLKTYFAQIKFSLKK